MKKPTPLSENLTFLRNDNGYSLEALAEKIGVSRQAVAKWENGETAPDIMNCEALAKLYGVSLDGLVNHDTQEAGTNIPPKGKHMFGTTKVGERGQIVLPKDAREIMNIQKGDTLVVLGDEDPSNFGIALVPSSYFLGFADIVRNSTSAKSDDQ